MKQWLLRGEALDTALITETGEEGVELTPDLQVPPAESLGFRPSPHAEEEDPLLEKDTALKDLESEFTEEMFTQSRLQREEDDFRPNPKRLLKLLSLRKKLP
jgi:hypothetical protein